VNALYKLSCNKTRYTPAPISHKNSIGMFDNVFGTEYDLYAPVLAQAVA
jgi:hypothetical protein